MRLIGHLPDEKSAAAFCSFLWSQGIENQVETEDDRCALWVHSEEQWTRAGALLEEFQRDPAQARFKLDTAALLAAAERALETARIESSAPTNPLLHATVPYGVGAVTLVLVLVSLALAFLGWVGYEDNIFQELLITSLPVEAASVPVAPALTEVAQGEFWRLLTPVLVNVDVLPLMFNLLLLLHLGSMIESCVGTGRLGALFIVIGVLSNLAQFYVSGPAFCGAAGVLFGLLGYVWIRGRLDPASGIFLRPHTVMMMLVFYLVGMAGSASGLFKLSLGTTAQVTGLALGLIWGFLSALTARRRAGP